MTFKSERRYTLNHFRSISIIAVKMKIIEIVALQKAQETTPYVYY